MSMRRLRALIYKEYLQLIRDNSSFLIGIVLPIILIFLIGSGVSMDIKNVNVAVVLEDSSPEARHAVSFLQGSEYYSPHYLTNFQDARAMMDTRMVDAILVIPPDFSARLYQHEGKMQLILYGVEPTTASALQGYIEGSIRQLNVKVISEGKGIGANSAGGMNGQISVESRIWFNDANTSTWVLVPGIMMLIVTLVGVFLTALVMAREWERGTLESIFVTPVRVVEIVVAKIMPYFCVASIGFILCLLIARFYYRVPIHGSLLLLTLATVLYLFVTLGMGMVISAVTKSQFLAAQFSLVASFLPSFLMTGFIFDLRSVPAAINVIGHIFPATYYLEVLRSLLLTGNNIPLVGRDCLILCGYVVLFLRLAVKATRKRVE